MPKIINMVSPFFNTFATVYRLTASVNDETQHGRRRTKERLRMEENTKERLWNSEYIKIMDHPRTGLGHPEPLVGGKDITYSRHITGKDVIIYEIYDDVISVLVLSVEGHYDDK